MSKFEGPVRPDQMPDVEISYDGPYEAPRVSGEVEAVKAMFQRERDAELGRWRGSWRDYVIYPDKDDADLVFVTNERDGSMSYQHREDHSFTDVSHAAREWFDAHPAKKPWHDAVQGEAWVLTWHGEEVAAVVDGMCFETSQAFIEITSEDISAGRKIWPEGDNDE